jgi:Tfp pilus assembly protein PilO
VPPAPPAPPPIPDFDPVIVGGMFEPSIWQNPAFVATIVLIVALTIVFFPLMRALAKRVERGAGEQALQGELEELRARLAEVEATQHRLADIEERLDFAERLLARGPAPAPERIGGADA